MTHDANRGGSVTRAPAIFESEVGFTRAAGPALLVALYGVLAAWSWGKWIDPQIDFGNQLYIPWQLTEGQALYRDIAYRNGPLSQHLNALWFALFGVSVRTLVLCNLAILAGLAAMTFQLFARACGHLTATVVVAVLLCVFAFSQYTGSANYNYVAPYQHGQTHGLVLTVAMIVAFCAALRSGRAHGVAVAGTCLGLVLLTKLELSVPAAATAGLGMVWIARAEPDWARRGRLGVVFLASLALPVALCFALLCVQLSPGQALVGVLGNWAYLGGGLLQDTFYLRGAGLADIPANLLFSIRMFVGLALFAVGTAAVDRWVPVRAWSGPLVAAAVFAVGLASGDGVPWPDLPRALPYTMLVAVAAFTALGWRAPDRSEILRWAPLAMWAVFALLLLSKMILKVRIHHYGFVLAMPATLLVVALYVHFLPAWLRSRYGGGGLARVVAIAAVGAGAVFFLRLSDANYSEKDLTLGAGGDAIVVENERFSRRGHLIGVAMERLVESMPEDATLLVLPEGVGVNYWLRRVNPTRYTLFLPTELDAFGGETAVLENLREHPPDFVLLLHREYEEFGAKPFGTGPRSGLRIMEWVNASYERRARIGAEPFRKRFGAVILQRRAARTEAEQRDPR